MRDDYKMGKPTGNLSVQIEKEVIDAIQIMEKHTKLTEGEIVNTAIKRFISQHKDFLPTDYSAKKNAS